MPAVKLRIGKNMNLFFEQRKLYYNGWKEFLSVINLEYENRIESRNDI